MCTFNEFIDAIENFTAVQLREIGDNAVEINGSDKD